MSDWKPKRFWTTATVVKVSEGYAVQLDGRDVKTPAKAPFILPTEKMASVIAAEWDAQEKEVDPRTMPVTRSANAAIDKVRPQRDEVIGLLAEYGDSDLLCYRAAGPEELIARQAAGWDLMLDWAAETLNARLFVGEGVMHVEQRPEALANLRRELDGFSDFALAGVHDLISISGSLVLALGVTKGAVTPEKAWDLSRIDEAWQTEQWGEDEEAQEVEVAKKSAFLNAALVYSLS